MHLLLLGQCSEEAGPSTTYKRRNVSFSHIYSEDEICVPQTLTDAESLVFSYMYALFWFSVLFVQVMKRLVSLFLCLCRFLQQLRKDHAGVQTPDRRRFASVDEALQRLLPYHVFQGAPPSQDEFSQGMALNLLP